MKSLLRKQLRIKAVVPEITQPLELMHMHMQEILSTLLLWLSLFLSITFWRGFKALVAQRPKAPRQRVKQSMLQTLAASGGGLRGVGRAGIQHSSYRSSSDHGAAAREKEANRKHRRKAKKYNCADWEETAGKGEIQVCREHAQWPP